MVYGIYSIVHGGYKPTHTIKPIAKQVQNKNIVLRMGRRKGFHQYPWLKGQTNPSINQPTNGKRTSMGFTSYQTWLQMKQPPFGL